LRAAVSRKREMNRECTGADHRRPGVSRETPGERKDGAVTRPAFWNMKKNYYDLNSYWRGLFGCRVHKLQIDAGFTCPNRDGTLASGGCIYCDGRGSELRRRGPLPSVTDQLRAGKAYYRKRGKAEKFIAYFQTFTNTYAPLEHLRALYDEALAEEDVVGLSVGTRPDCVPDTVLDLLAVYGQRRHVWLELGLQSLHDRTLAFLNRGHDAATFLDAVRRAAARGLRICTHIIVGLPGESRADILATAEMLAALPVQGIKIHALLALRGTPLGDLYEQGRLTLMTKTEYVVAVCDVLEILPPEMVIQRLTADGYRDIFLAPDWAARKLEVLAAIDGELARRESHQGIRYAGDGIRRDFPEA
jgi:uncharacterized protein